MAYSLSSERPTIAAWPLTVIASLLRIVNHAAKVRRRRIALKTLLDMNDYRLWDLGISRADLRRALNSDDFDFEAIRDTRRYLDVWPPV